MIPLLTREAVRAIDADAVARLRLPSLVLMENAGRAAAACIAETYPGRLARVVIVGGAGQNGGDAWVVARHLCCAGYTPRVLLVGEHARVRGDAQINLEVLGHLGLDVTVLGDDLAPLEAALRKASLIVDGLFGTGLDRAVAGVHAEVIARINGADVPCVSLDVPSGIDADTGQVRGVAVHAQHTVTFAAHKRGLHQYPGVAHAGCVHLVSIGVPSPNEASAMLLQAGDVTELVRRRPADAHKGSAGRVLVIAGAPGRTGAALLAGLGALRAGAGLVTLAARGQAQAALDAKVIELMTSALPMDAAAGVASALELAEGQAAVALGPGVGTDPEASTFCCQLARQLPMACVLDADALSALGQDLAQLREAKGLRVLTPHPREAARLLGWATEEVQADRYGAAVALAERTGHVAVLKGARTVVADPSGRVCVCGPGTPALGVAGTGDVLTGILASRLVEQAPFAAACSAVLLHALAGEAAAVADRGLLAREVADGVPRVLADAWQPTTGPRA